LKRFATVAEALDELVELSEAALEEDPKIATVIERIKAIRKEEPKANVLVYTEYTDSQDALAKALEEADIGRVLTLSGKDSEKTRTDVTDKFSLQNDIILVSTDASAEGLNLQSRCHHLIHLELPFNPNRLEQRNGRIDRYGQTKEPIVSYLYLRGTFEERILIRLIAKYEKQRERLTFLPNTLGGITCSTDAGTQPLLKDLIQEEAGLFEVDEVEFDFKNPDDGLSSEAARELIEEIDRSLKGYEQAAMTRSWLSNTGINAEARLFEEADAARKKGERGSAVDLAHFVLDSVRLEGGSVKEIGKVYEISLPPTWTYGLQDLPGYDEDSRRILLTTDIDLTRDENDRHVGFLGRSHPLVSRALQRVRNIRFGDGGSQVQDRRASAVSADVPKPQVLFTFLGRIVSGVGREYEQVLAVLMDESGLVDRFDSAERWLPFADQDRGISTEGVWDKYFAGWEGKARSEAARVAKELFEPIAETFLKGRKTVLDREEQSQQEWLRQRSGEITGQVTQESQQLRLFDQGEGETEVRSWGRIDDPEKRIAAFASDRSNPPALRSEAETVLRILKDRKKDFEARRNTSKSEIVPLGILMIVPEARE
jgi:hypothetical protein